VVYLKVGGTTNLVMREAQGAFNVRWHDPRNGGSLQVGSVKQITGGENANLGNPPSDIDRDWVILVRKQNG